LKGKWGRGGSVTFREEGLKKPGRKFGEVLKIRVKKKPGRGTENRFYCALKSLMKGMTKSMRTDRMNSRNTRGRGKLEEVRPGERSDSEKKEKSAAEGWEMI